MHAARPYGSDLRWAGLKRQVPGATARRAAGPVAFVRPAMEPCDRRKVPFRFRPTVAG